MAERRIFLIRHGEYDLHSEKRLLTARGRRQARRAARRLSREPLTAITSSKLPRAVETAQIIAEPWPDLVVRHSGLLNECLPVVPEHLKGKFTKVPKERIQTCREHAELAFRRHFKSARGSDRCELIVGHGNLLRYVICLAMGMKREDWLRMALNHCGISEFRVTSRGRVLFIAHNDQAHLPPELRSG